MFQLNGYVIDLKDWSRLAAQSELIAILHDADALCLVSGQP